MMKHLVTAMLLVATGACASVSSSGPSSVPDGSGAPDGASASTTMPGTSPPVGPAASGGVESHGEDAVELAGEPAPVPTLADEVLAEANWVRRQAGSPALRVDARLERAAERYSRELARREEIEHVSTTPGRRTFRERIEIEGTDPRIAGENLARLTASRRRLARRTVQAWMRSPGHRYNLLDGQFTRTGIGVEFGDDQVWYVVQYYATPD